MFMASNGHFYNEQHLQEVWTTYKSNTFTQIPQPMHNDSDIVAILSCGVTSMHNFPGECLTLEKNNLTWTHPFGWQDTTFDILADIF